MIKNNCKDSSKYGCWNSPSHQKREKTHAASFPQCLARSWHQQCYEHKPNDILGNQHIPLVYCARTHASTSETCLTSHHSLASHRFRGKHIQVERGRHREKAGTEKQQAPNTRFPWINDETFTQLWLCFLLFQVEWSILITENLNIRTVCTPMYIKDLKGKHVSHMVSSVIISC